MKFFRLSVLVVIACLGSVAVQAQDEPVRAPSTYNETRLSALEEQMRVINGRLEQVEFAVRRLDQTLLHLQSDFDSRLTKLEQTPPAQTIVTPPPMPLVNPAINPAANPVVPQPVAPLSSTAPVDLSPNGTLGALKMQNGKITGGVVNPQAPPLPVTPPDYGLTPQEQYEKAFGFLRQADYAAAEQGFKSFIDKNPKDKLVDNAKYWYGETLYVRAEFDQAAVAFADAFQQNPQGNKAPDSLLKLAMSLGALNKVQDACTTLMELKSKYPSAAATIKSRADDERTRLKCPAR